MIIKPLDLLADHVTLREFVVIPESPTSGGWYYLLVTLMVMEHLTFSSPTMAGMHYHIREGKVRRRGVSNGKVSNAV